MFRVSFIFLPINSISIRYVLLGAIFWLMMSVQHWGCQPPAWALGRSYCVHSWLPPSLKRTDATCMDSLESKHISQQHFSILLGLLSISFYLIIYLFIYSLFEVIWMAWLVGATVLPKYSRVFVLPFPFIIRVPIILHTLANDLVKHFGSISIWT